MTRYVIRPEQSRVTATAKSSVHPIQVQANYVTGAVEVQLVDGAVDLGTPAQVVIEVELDDLHAENQMYDGELKRRIDAQRYPNIKGTVTEVGAGAHGALAVRGELSLHGKTSAVEGTATVRESAAGLQVSGELDLDIRDFGLNPPRILMLRVYPEVHVDIELVTEPE